MVFSPLLKDGPMILHVLTALWGKVKQPS